VKGGVTQANANDANFDHANRGRIGFAALKHDVNLAHIAPLGLEMQCHAAPLRH